MVHFSSDGGGEHIGAAQVLVMFLDQPTVPGRRGASGSAAHGGVAAESLVLLLSEMYSFTLK